MQRRLLIADDNEQFSRMVEFVAKRNGWKTSSFRNGRSLLVALREVNVNALLLLDVLMPDMDGIECIKELKRVLRGPNLRIRFVTGGEPINLAAAQLIALGHSFDVGDPIYKPITMAELEEILAQENKIIDGKEYWLD